MLEPAEKRISTIQISGIAKKQLEVAKAQGDSYFNAVKEMIKEVGHGEIRSEGNYSVGCAVNAAEGFYKFETGVLIWYEPHNVNTHIEITIADVDDGRFIPGLEVAVSIADKNGNSIGTELHPFVWHPWIFHYGRNWKLPGDGVYEISVLIEPPQFVRRDKRYGNKYVAPVRVTFPRVEIKTGVINS